MEIEIKAHIRNKSKLLQQLRKIGKEISTVIQIDRIFLPQGSTFDTLKPGTPVLRIRKVGHDIVFTLKIRNGLDLAKIEKETKVTDEKSLREILIALNYREVLVLRKKRTEFSYKNVSICLDKVDGLGEFVEIETFSRKNVSSVQLGLETILYSLGIDKDDLVYEGYDTMMAEKM